MSAFFDKLLGKDTKFFDLLRSGAIESKNSAQLLITLHSQLGTSAFDKTMESLGESRRRHKRIHTQCTQELCQTFVTPLEREDIEALSTALYKIQKTDEKIGERLSICPDQFRSDIVGKQLQMLASASDVVAGMVESLCRKEHGENMQDAYEKLQNIENDADKLMVGLLKELYSGSIEAKEVIILKDIYEMLERAIDRCRDAGKVVFSIALKYS
ncbi:MAG: hypothetical protein RL095_763 [Verrucomicrobiota bacterium]|jgi:uncharacterized protein Yka (UPF0111/DUF47 family)